MKKEYPSFSDESIERMYLYERMESDKATAKDLVRLEFLFGMISKESYEDYLEIEKTYNLLNEETEI